MSETDNNEVDEVQHEGNGTTPFYNQPEDADRYPVAIPNPLPTHTVFKGDPRVDGPYLDDIREAQEEARRDAKDRVHQIQKQKQEEGQKLLESLKAESGPEETTEEETEKEEEETPVYTGGFNSGQDE